MDVIVLTYPEEIKNEHLFLKRLFAAGLETLHIRKPAFSERDMWHYLERIPIEYLDRVVLHSCWSLKKSFPIKGLHGFADPSQRKVHKEFGNSDPSLEFDLDVELSGGTRSCSLHSLEEVEEVSSLYQYAFLSPIYNSISKEGYISQFTTERLKLFLHQYPIGKRKTRVIALGGVDESNVSELKDLSFDGMALLGAIWQETNYNCVKKFERIQELVC